MIDIKDVIAKFSLKLSPERKISLFLKDFFKEKGIPYSGKPVKIAQTILTIDGDVYIKSYIQTHQKELLSVIQTYAPTVPITKIR